MKLYFAHEENGLWYIYCKGDPTKKTYGPFVTKDQAKEKVKELQAEDDT